MWPISVKNESVIKGLYQPTFDIAKWPHPQKSLQEFKNEALVMFHVVTS